MTGTTPLRDTKTYRGKMARPIQGGTPRITNDGNERQCNEEATKMTQRNAANNNNDPATLSNGNSKLGYACICGFRTANEAEFRKHLIFAGKRDGKGTHRSLGIVDSNTGDVVKRPRGKQRSNEQQRGPQQEELQGGQIVTVTQGKPAAVVFSLGAEKIELEPQALYESYLLYLDLKARLDLKDGFTATLRDALAFTWRLFVSRPQIEQGQVRPEFVLGPQSNQPEGG